VSTGELNVESCARSQLGPTLARILPREVLLSQNLDTDLHDLIKESGAAVSTLSASSFDSANANKRLCDVFSVKSLDGFGQFQRAEVAALGGIVEYLDITQKGKLTLLQPPVRQGLEPVMQIDAATRRNLELTKSISGEREGTLLSVIDRTVTGPGARLLLNRVSSPSIDIKTVNSRLDSVGFFFDQPSLCEDLRNELKKTPDMSRALSRLSLERGGPRDLGAIAVGLAQAEVVFQGLGGSELPPRMAAAILDLRGFSEIKDLLRKGLKTELPILTRDGGFIKSGYDDELDGNYALRDDGRLIIAKLQGDYNSLTSITSLKIKYNNVLGYFVEVPSAHSKTMLSEKFSEKFIHRQTNANAVRFTTLELSELETKILNAAGRALEIEKRIFEEMRQKVLSFANKIALAANCLAEVDHLSALAELARSEGWCRPVLSEDQRFDIVAGRHPVVSAALKAGSETPFVPNDCNLTPDSPDSACAWLLTGPNMAGKSTFLRQNALIALLAQMGSFVPAQSAHIGMVTQLFSRVGASDDLARGRSTFMVEMVETAAILNQAKSGALVILDEIGRGTATYDGLSIAWATLESLHDVNKCRTLFATHYHELTALSSRLQGVSNATVSVREWEGEIIFLHEVAKGAADRSYGVQVAKLAGLPKSVTERAQTILHMLEKDEQGGKFKALVDDLPLFSAAASPPSTTDIVSPVEERLKTVLPDELAPMDALKLIYELQELASARAKNLKQ